MTRRNTRKSLEVSPNERIAIENKDLESFWFSRLQKMDPVARIGYAIWVSNPENLRKAIKTGNPNYWNHLPFDYWYLMGKSTTVNLAWGLTKGGFKGSEKELRGKIKEVGIAVANQHVIFTDVDYTQRMGKVPGLLSLKQMADYHHKAFENFNIPSSFYGGTWLSLIPDQFELDTYGFLYCHDCDSAEGYQDRNK